MERNVGERDRLLRTIFGIYGMLLGFLFIQGVIGIIVGAIGLVSLVTGIVGVCGIYKLMGISTVKAGESDDAVTAEPDDAAPDKETE